MFPPWGRARWHDARRRVTCPWPARAREGRDAFAKQSAPASRRWWTGPTFRTSAQHRSRFCATTCTDTPQEHGALTPRRRFFLSGVLQRLSFRSQQKSARASAALQALTTFHARCKPATWHCSAAVVRQRATPRLSRPRIHVNRARAIMARWLLLALAQRSHDLPSGPTA